MIEYWGSKDTYQKAELDKQKSEEKGRGSIVVTNDNRNVYPNTPQAPGDKPSWVEKGTLIVLVLTFFAAIYAGYEGQRLANWTQKAVSDAEVEANRQARDTGEQLGFMRKQLDVMKVDQRPWIGMAAVGTIPNDPTAGIYYFLTITNAGKSPAFDVSVSVGDWKQDANAVHLFTEKCSNDCRERNIEMVPSNQLGVRIPLIGEALPQVGDTVWLISSIDYRDSEGGWHKTGICYTATSAFSENHKSVIITDTGCTIPNSNYAD